MFLGIIVDRHALCKQRRVRNVAYPWITPVIKKLMFPRDKFKKNYFQGFLLRLTWAIIGILKIRLTIKLRMLKLAIIILSFYYNSTNIKNTWRGMNNLIGTETSSTKISQIHIWEDIRNRLILILKTNLVELN